MKPKHTLLALLTLAASAVSSQAGTITWGNNPVDKIYDSTGTAIPDGTSAWTFAMGTFGSFVPTGSNTGSWAANWKPLDAGTGITGGSGSGNYNSPAPLFGGDYITDTFNLSLSGVALISSDSVSSFAGGEKVYTWVYNSQSMLPGSEWGLYTHSSWALPTSTNSNDIDLFNAAWRLDGPNGDLSVTPIWGSLYSSTSSTSTDVIGTNKMGSTNFGLQTATIAAVPEPSAALLIGMMGMVQLVRRRRTQR
jgi:hypothetical protein